MRFWSLFDHRCRARSAHRTRNLKFVLRTYANASSQRIHRVSKRLHKACAKRPETLSSEKSVNWDFFSLPSFLETQRSQRRRAHVSSHQPRPKAAAPPQQWGWLVRALVVRVPTSRARSRHRASLMPQRQRPSTSTASETKPPTPRGARRAAPFAPTNASPVTAKWAIGDRSRRSRRWGGGSQASPPKPRFDSTPQSVFGPEIDRMNVRRCGNDPNIDSPRSLVAGAEGGVDAFGGAGGEGHDGHLGVYGEG